MNPTKVVVHEVKGHGMTVILDLFAESIRQASETAHSHSHAEVLPFNVRRTNVLRVGVAGDGTQYGIRCTLRGCSGSQQGCRASRNIFTSME